MYVCVWISIAFNSGFVLNRSVSDASFLKLQVHKDFNYHLGNGSPHIKNTEESTASIRKQVLWKMVLTVKAHSQKVNVFSRVSIEW